MGAPRDLRDIVSTSLGTGALPFAGDARAVLLLVYMLILAGEAEEDFEKAAVTKEEAFALRKDFFVGWRDAGLWM
jgi:hypothetical protein